MDISANYYAVILAGGGGTRLWPKSRKRSPKHLLKLFGNRTLIQTVYDAISPIIPNERILITTNKDHLESAKRQLPQIPQENWIGEPIAKGTAMAMAVSAAYVHKRDENAVIMNLWADPMITNVEGFQKAISSSLNAAQNQELLVAIVERPTFAHTGLGYIHAGMKLGIPNYEGKLPVFKSLEFKEKPDLETAARYLQSKEYFWNTGMYSWSTKTIFAAFAKYAPQFKIAVDKLLQAIGTPEEKEVLGQIYNEAENTTIDYAISEKADNMAMVEGDFGWSDIGDWKVVYDILPKDEAGNVVLERRGNFVGVNTTNSLVEVNGRLIVMVGVDNLVVVDTADAVLICPKDRTQDVKKAVEKLKLEKKDEYL